MSAPDATHDPDLRSWVESANTEGTDFPIQNLPLGVFTRDGESPALGVAIGDHVLDLRAAAGAGCLGVLPAELGAALGAPVLNPLLGLGREHWRRLRTAVSASLRTDAEARPDPGMLPARSSVRMLLPMQIGDYTDFYASVHHATNVGSMFRPDNPLLPNYKHVPIGYHGRASSVVVSGTAIRRPSGQTRPQGLESPVFGPSRLLDYECEVGMVIGPGNTLGDPIPMARAADHLFGYCLLNDWSARDIQAWEYQPLGPFLAKSFATTLSPWIVTVEALAPFRVPARSRPEGDPAPLAYLDDAADRSHGGVDIRLEVLLRSAAMRERADEPHRLSLGNFREMYWTPAQLVAHHASNGCNLRPGDLLGSGTVSGATPDTFGSLLELTWRGSRPLTLPDGSQRRFLEDGDEVTLRGRCEREGFAAIGFGECTGVVT